MSFLVLEIEFLAGVCRAAHSPASAQPDWPVQPDRVFSALVSSWAVRGERSNERMALEWLETQPPPAVHAGGHTARTTPDVFVPPNDQRSSSTAETYLKVMPERRPRQPRRFPVACLDDPVMELVWPQRPAGEIVDALDAMSRDVGYIGHSASLVRCRFLSRTAPATAHHAAAPARRRVYPGRLRELEREYARSPARPVIRSGATIPEQPPPDTRSPAAPGAGDWLVLEVVGGDVPDIRATALVARTLRYAVMSGYRSIGRKDEVPEVVSGHDPASRQSRLPHMGIAPMAVVGHPHADGRVVGFALIPPAATSLRDIPGLRGAWEHVAQYNPGSARRVLTLHDARLLLHLSPAGAAIKISLSPQPYLQSARVWASVTPIVLDRHLKRYDEAVIRNLVARSCVNAGLPRPDPARIQVGNHSGVEGAPSAWSATENPPWTRWRVPEPLASRRRVHAVIDFGREIAGPVMLGAGRYSGLGLCRRMGA